MGNINSYNSQSSIGYITNDNAYVDGNIIYDLFGKISIQSTDPNKSYANNLGTINTKFIFTTDSYILFVDVSNNIYFTGSNLNTDNVESLLSSIITSADTITTNEAFIYDVTPLNTYTEYVSNNSIKNITHFGIYNIYIYILEKVDDSGVTKLYRITNGKNKKMELYKQGFGDLNIKKIVSGYNHVLFLTSSGRVYVIGDNKYGQLGLGHTQRIDIPTLIETENGIRDIHAFGNISVIIKSNNDCYLFGENLKNIIKATDGNVLLPYFIGKKVTSITGILNNNIQLLLIKSFELPNKSYSILLRDETDEWYVKGSNEKGHLMTSQSQLDTFTLNTNIPSNITQISCTEENTYFVTDTSNTLYKSDIDNISFYNEVKDKSDDIIKNIIFLSNSFNTIDYDNKLYFKSTVVDVKENNIGKIINTIEKRLIVSGVKKSLINIKDPSIYQVIEIYANDYAFCFIVSYGTTRLLYAFGESALGGHIPSEISDKNSKFENQTINISLDIMNEKKYKVVNTKYAFGIHNYVDKTFKIWGHPLYGGIYKNTHIIKNCLEVYANDYAFLIQNVDDQDFNVIDDPDRGIITVLGHPLYGGHLKQFRNINKNIERYNLKKVYKTKYSFTLKLEDTERSFYDNGNIVDRTYFYYTLGIHSTNIITE